MKPLFFLIVIAGLAAGGWWMWKGRAPSAPPAAAAATLPGPDSDPTALPAPGETVPPGATATPDVAPPKPGLQVPATVAADFAQAEALWEAAAKASPADPAQDPSAARMARLYSNVLRGTYGTPDGEAVGSELVRTRLAALGTALFFSRNRYDDPLFAVHSVQSGDVPDKIAKQYGMTYQHLNRMRGRDIHDSALKIGDGLKVIRLKEAGGSQLYIDKSEYRVDLYLGGVFARRYDVSIGAVQSPTPVGRTTVTNLVFDPPWTSPIDNKVYPPGDPGNILGGVWIALDAAGIGGKTGIGLHGYTGEDQTLRKQASNGCIRLGNEAIKELAWLIAPPARSPSTVEIVE